MLIGFIAEPLMFVVRVLLRVRDFKSAYKVFLAQINVTFYLATVSYYTQIIIWTERYFGIFHPYLYRKWIVKGLLGKTLTALWVILLVSNTVVGLFFNDKRDIFTIYSFPIAVIWCIYVQLKILCPVKRIRHEIASLSRLNQEKNHETHSLATSKATKIGLSIFAAMVICYTPYAVIYFLEYYKLANDVRLRWHCPWISFLVLFNSLCNFVIYSIRMREIRNSIITLVRDL